MSVPPSPQLIPGLEDRGGVSCHAKSMLSVMNMLELLSRQKGLTVHVSPSGTACYITSMMFYVEIQLEKDGNVMDVKLAHFEEAPVVCDDLVQLLRMKNYDAFGKILEDLSNMYQIPGNSKMKAKGYLALQALEKDLYSMSLLDRTQDLNRVTEVLNGKVGHLVPRTGGTPMNIEFYISPYQVLEAELNNGSQILKLERTGIQISGLKLAPLYEIIVRSTLKEKSIEDLSTNKSCFFVSLPDCPKHCYFINKGSEKSDLAGALVSKIPFRHPKCVPGVIEILRHQVAYNTLISSCISEKHINEVVIDVITSREVQCHLHLNPQVPTLNSSDDFMARAVKRCMSVPVVMRAVFRNIAKLKADIETQDMDTEQQPERQLEQTTDSKSLEKSLSGAGQQDWVMTDKPSTTDSAKENLSPVKLETLADNMAKN